MPQIQAHDEVETVVRAHVGWVHACARRRLGDPATAQDVTQAVFILFWRKRASLHEGVKLTGWLYRAVRYCANNALRLQQIREHHEREAAMTGRQDRPSGDGARARDGDGDGDGEAGWSAVSPVLEQAVDRLSEAHRSAVLLRFYRQMSFAEVGQALGISEDAAKKRVERAVGKLREALAAKGVETEAASLAGLVLAHVGAGGVEGLVERIVAGMGEDLGSGTAGAIAQGAAKTMVMAKVKVVVVVGVALAASGLVIAQVASSSPTSQRPVAAAVTGVADAKVAAFAGTLKTGVSAELLGVAENPSGHWWRADGSPLPMRPYPGPTRGNLSPDTAGRGLEFAFRVTGPAGLVPGLAPDQGMEWRDFDPVDAAYKPIAGLRTRMAVFPKGIATDTLRVQIWAAPWHDEKVFGGTNANPPMSGVISSDVALRGTIRLEQLAELGRLASVRVDEPKEGSDAVAIRVVAMDMGGKVHPPLDAPPPMREDRVVSTLRFPLRLAQVKAFALQSRRYAGWVEFQNISLKEGVKTDVRIVTGDDAAVPRAGDGRLVRVGDRLAVTIWDLVGPNQASILRLRVGDSGRIRLPLAGMIPVAGSSADGVNKAVNQAYYDRNLIRNAVVEVHFIEDAYEPAVKAGPLQAGDTVLLRIWDVEAPNVETVRRLQVSKDGRVTPPSVGDVTVVGMSEDEAAEAIAKAYEVAEVIRRATLTVERLQK